MDYLDFEQPIADIATEIESFQKNSSGAPGADEYLRNLNKELIERTKTIYDSLTPWQTVQIARHKDRPHTVDYLSLVFDEFIELHGDKLFGDDPAIRVGFARLDNTKVMVLGHQRGAPSRTVKKRISAVLILKAIEKRWPKCGWRPNITCQ
jgi:acetyl-CoA carboxylase carboxyl transferase subunit alpha